MGNITAAIITVLFSISASADVIEMSDISINQIAQFMIDAKVIKCVEEMRVKTKNFEVQASLLDGGHSVIRTSGAGKLRTSDITFDLIEGGDMIMGTATISVVEKYRAQFGFEENGATIPYVDSCSVKIKNQ